jgi:hypothetical protein
MPETGKSRIIVLCLALLVVVVVGGVSVWLVSRSDVFGHWRFGCKLTRLAEECAEAGRSLQFMTADSVEIHIADPVLEEDGRFIRPAAIEFRSGEGAVLTRYELAVYDDLNENDDLDPGEPAWTWIEERPEGILFDQVFEPPRKPVSEQAETLNNPRYRIEIEDSITGTFRMSGIVNPLMKPE